MNPTKLIIILTVIVVIVVSPATSHAENWPGFRGPTGLGYTQENNLPVTWGGPDNKNILWKAPLTGQGHASPIVWEDSVFTCTVN
jgi:outer membrane protein assembly factor BamB